MFERYSRSEICIKLIVAQNIISVKDAEIKIVMAKTIYDFEGWEVDDGYYSFKFISIMLRASIRRHDIEYYT